MNKKFPVDCPKTCKYFHCWDMSIDDYTCYCEKLKVQIDECDAYDGLHILPFCPLNEENTYGTK